MSVKFFGMTLVELIIAIVLISIIGLGIMNIDYFSHFHVLSASRRTRAQNDATIALGYMARQISRAIGNEMLNGVNSVVNIDTSNAAFDILRIYIDASGNGRRESPIFNPGLAQDRWIAYRYEKLGGTRYVIRYCSRCRNVTCAFPGGCLDTIETIANNIRSIGITKPVNASSQLNNNFLTINIESCWNPALASSLDNPCVTMDSRIFMPSVTVN